MLKVLTNLPYLPALKKWKHLNRLKKLETCINRKFPKYTRGLDSTAPWDKGVREKEEEGERDLFHVPTRKIDSTKSSPFAPTVYHSHNTWIYRRTINKFTDWIYISTHGNVNPSCGKSFTSWVLIKRKYSNPSRRLNLHFQLYYDFLSVDPVGERPIMWTPKFTLVRIIC